MLHRVVQPSSYSSGQPIEGIQPVLGYARDPFPSVVPGISFRQDDEGETGSQDHESRYGDHSDEEKASPFLCQLAVNISYRELLHFFLVPDHEKIFSLRSGILQNRDKEAVTIFFPNGEAPKDFEKLRAYLYAVQIQLFQTPQGLHCHLIL